MYNSVLLNKNSSNVISTKLLFAFVIIYWAVGTFLFVKTGLVAVVVVMSLLPIIILIWLVYLKDLYVLLLFLSTISLLILPHSFSNGFKWLFIQDTPLFLFTLLALFTYLLQTNRLKMSEKSIIFPIILLFIYNVVMFAKAIYFDYNFRLAIEEFYRHFYYILTIPILILITKAEQYKYIFKLIIFIFIIISIEYLVVNLFSANRFTTYHNAFIPFVVGYFYFQMLTEYKNKQKMLKYVLIFIMIWGGSFLTETRILWVTNVITIVIITLLFLLYKNNVSLLKKKHLLLKGIFVFFILIIGVVLFINKSKTDDVQISGDVRLNQRVNAISSPLQDHSFLMRVEISYYAIMEFIKNPITGSGYGTFLRFKYLENTKVAFIDNSFLYFLWKGGIVGFVVFGFLYYRFFTQSFYILNRTKSLYTKKMMIVLLGSFVSFLFYGVLSANLIGYKLNLLYAIIFAYVEFERRELDNCKNLK